MGPVGKTEGEGSANSENCIKGIILEVRIHINTKGDRDPGQPNSDPLELVLMRQFRNHIIWHDFREVSCQHESGESKWVAQIDEDLRDWLLGWHEMHFVRPTVFSLYFHDQGDVS